MASNLPPGVTVGMIEAQFDEGPCDICGRGVDDCVCPVCPKCEAQGDHMCYRNHGLIVTAGQVKAYHEKKVWEAQEQLQDAQMALGMFESDTEEKFDGKDWNWIATRA